MLIDFITPEQQASMRRYARLSDQAAHGTCRYCGTFTRALAYRRRGCNYPHEESNWMLSCLACNNEELDYWSDMWAEYYAGVM